MYQVDEAKFSKIKMPDSLKLKNLNKNHIYTFKNKIENDTITINNCIDLISKYEFGKNIDLKKITHHRDMNDSIVLYHIGKCRDASNVIFYFKKYNLFYYQFISGQFAPNYKLNNK